MSTAIAIPNRAEVAHQIERGLAIFAGSDLTEIRILSTNSAGFEQTDSGYFWDHKSAAAAMQQYIGAPATNCYFVLNSIDPELFARAGNRIQPKAKQTTKDVDIVRRKWLFIDVDPKRAEGISASDSERELARTKAVSVRDWLIRQYGFPEPIVASSGNGWHLHFRIDMPNTNLETALLHSVLLAAGAKFPDVGSEIDPKVANASRICKLYGSWARKGDNVDGRPHRQSCIESVPETLVIVPIERLQAVAALAPEAAKHKKSSSRVSKTNGRKSVANRARAYVLKMDAAVQGEYGSKKAFDVARTLTRGFSLSIDDALPIMQEWNQSCVPPWLEHELLHKLTDAEKSVGDVGYLLSANRETSLRPEGMNGKAIPETESNACVLHLRNYETHTIDGEEISNPLSLEALIAQTRRVTDDWPRVASDRLFVPDPDSGVRWLVKPTQLSAFLSEGLDEPPNFKKAAGFIQEAVLFEALHTFQTRYDSVEFAPHEPPLENSYYAHEEIPAGDGTCLRWILDRFEPEKILDGDLIKAMLATAVWGGGGGQRPCFVVTAADRGAGKTTLVEIAGELTGGLIDVSAGEDVDKLKARLLSSVGRRNRVVLIDNLKSRKFSWSELESLITTPVISGRQNYVGEGQRSNHLLWCITMNGLALSRDMAQRCVIIRLSIPKFSGGWKDETLRYVRTHKQAILGDLIAFLRGPKYQLSKYTRWGSWESQVLARLPEPSEAQAVIMERQGSADVDSEETGLIEEHFRAKLVELTVNTESETVLIPSQVVARWYAEALGNRDLSPIRANRDITQRIDAGLIRSLHIIHRKDVGRGFLWCEASVVPPRGKNPPDPSPNWNEEVESLIEQREILLRNRRNAF